MRRSLSIAVLLLSATPAWAQSYQPYPPQQQAVASGYPAPVVAAYPQPQPAYAPAPQPQPAAQPYEARPGDAGQSVVTDIRQMNF